VKTIPEISDLEIHAYVDGELDASRARDIEGAASADSILAARIAGYRADKALLKRAYSPLAQEKLPSAWIELIQNHVAERPQTWSWRMVGAIAATILVLLAGVGFYLTQPQRPVGDVVQAALAVRDDAAIAVTNLAEARRYDGTLGRIVDADIKVPDLERMGYRVTGLGIYGHAAEVQYRDAQNNLFTLYLTASDGKTRFDQFEQKGMRICVWQDDRVSTVMAGTMSAAEMQRLASLAYLGLGA
jgi:anti-sigma factor RsiW